MSRLILYDDINTNIEVIFSCLYLCSLEKSLKVSNPIVFLVGMSVSKSLPNNHHYHVPTTY